MNSQRVGYLLGAGSSFLGGDGYPLATQLWESIKDQITEEREREAIQSKLDESANGIEQALDLLDDGGADDTPYRHSVTSAIASLFRSQEPRLTHHIEFVTRLARRSDRPVRVFSLNYDPLVERAADGARVRLINGFQGFEHSFFAPESFEERIGQIRGTYKARQFDETASPVQLLKLHGSLGWYECPTRGIRQCAFGSDLPIGTKPLLVPPQRRKVADTLHQPYSALWTAFRQSLVHGPNPVNRLACIGYGFSDEHVNDVIRIALSRTDFTLLVFTRFLSDAAWLQWSGEHNAVIVTENRCSLNGRIGPGHDDYWRFETLCSEV